MPVVSVGWVYDIRLRAGCFRVGDQRVDEDLMVLLPNREPNGSFSSAATHRSRIERRPVRRVHRRRRSRYVRGASGEDGPAKRSSGSALLKSDGIVNRTNDGRNL